MDPLTLCCGPGNCGREAEAVGERIYGENVVGEVGQGVKPAPGGVDKQEHSR